MSEYEQGGCARIRVNTVLSYNVLLFLEHDFIMFVIIVLKNLKYGI
jgi:hypothetical protein